MPFTCLIRFRDPGRPAYVEDHKHRGRRKLPSDQRRTLSESSSGSPSRSALAAARPETLLIDDDGKHLWASPTDGAPLDLSPLPLGGQLFIVVRPAEIMMHAEGAKTIGP